MAVAYDISPPRTRVWDLPVRLFHWALLAAVATAGVTGFLLPLTWINLHLIGGTLVAALLLFRLVWGFTGSAYSRFASFAFSPGEILKFTADHWQGRSRHFTGHNPLGAAMIFALLGVLALLVITGTVALGGTEKQGPLHAVISFAFGRVSLNLHQLAAYGLLVLIAGHLGGVIFESLRSGENLPAAMVTGRKRFASGEVQPAARPVTAIAVFCLTTFLIAVPAFALWRLPPSGVPTRPMDPAYVEACGDCHVVYHPSLRNGETWETIMGNLDDHFGEDASLPADQVDQLRSYLEANAAERWDTRAANMFRTDDPQDPLRITATAFWRYRHHGIDPAVFKRSKVGAKSNCNACHGDATAGLFSPQAIHIPEETKK
jgi:cytochrome b